MKLWLPLFAMLVVCGVLAYRVSTTRPPSSVNPKFVTHAAAKPPAAAGPLRAAPEPPLPTARPTAPEAARVGPAPGEPGGGPRTWTVQEIDADRTERMAAAAHAHEKNIERYASARRRFDHEHRDEAWASAREAALRRLSIEDGFEHLLVDVVCRTTLCELRWELGSSHALGHVTPGATATMREVGDDTASSLEDVHENRLFIMLAPRPGTKLARE